MGLLYDLYILARRKKRCTVCGCVLVADVDVDICEVCVAEMSDD